MKPVARYLCVVPAYIYVVLQQILHNTESVLPLPNCQYLFHEYILWVMWTTMWIKQICNVI